MVSVDVSGQFDGDYRRIQEDLWSSSFQRQRERADEEQDFAGRKEVFKRANLHVKLRP